MIEFILIAWLTGAPDDCRTEPRLLTYMTLMQCVTRTQFLAADWQNDHPSSLVQPHSRRVFNPEAAQL